MDVLFTIINHLRTFYREVDVKVDISYDGVEYFSQGMFIWDYNKMGHNKMTLNELRDALGDIADVRAFAKSLIEVKLILKTSIPYVIQNELCEFINL